MNRCHFGEIATRNSFLVNRQLERVTHCLQFVGTWLAMSLQNARENKFRVQGALPVALESNISS